MQAPPRYTHWTYGLAYLGAHLAFMPLLVLLLPRKVEALAPDNAAIVLSWMLVTGAVVAGASNIVAGALSDTWVKRFGHRRGLIALGAGALSVSYIALAVAQSIEGLFAAIIGFQIALNACFAPLGVLLADHFPNEIKGRLSGLGNAALPGSSLLLVPIAWLFPQDSAFAFLFVGAASTLFMAPLLVFWGLGEAIAQEALGEPEAHVQNAEDRLVSDFTLAWLSRLLVQTGAAFAIGYIYLYVSATRLAQTAWDGAEASELLAWISAPTAILAIIATLGAGAISDHKGLRRAPLFVSACVFALGMAVLGLTPPFAWFFLAYALVQMGLSAYLSVDAALVAQLVEGHSSRGLLLGVMNLSNTFPSVIAPTLALLSFAETEVASALSTLFAVFALAALASGFLVLLIRRVR